MPGKHAPASPRSFYLSVARAVAGALAVLALVVLIAMAAVNSGDDAPAAAQRSEDPKATNTPTTRQSPAPPPGSPTPTASAREIRARSRVSVLVLNATNRAGLAARVRAKLLDAGYDDVEVGNAPDRARSLVYYRGSFRPEAGRLLKDLDQGGLLERAPDDLQGDARLTIILGADFEE